MDRSSSTSSPEVVVSSLSSSELTDSIIGDVGALLGRAAAADGTPPLGEQAVKAVSAGGTERHLVAVDAGKVVGYAAITVDNGTAMAEAAVDPDSRGRGIGRALVARALDDGGAGSRIWAHGNLPAARALAAALDLTIVRELLQMRRPLGQPELPEVVVPEGISLRTYRGHQDDEELLRVNNAAFSWHPEQGGWSTRDIDARRDEEWFDPAGLFLAFEEGTDHLLGFHWTKVHAPDANDPALGEVYVVGIDPAAQGRGLGRVLTLAGLRYLRGRELADVLLYVESDNVAAVHTYERLAFTRFHVDAAYARR